VFCSFHQTVPDSHQVVVPIRHTWRRRTDFHQTRVLNLNMRFNGG
jgi:fructosamine-3-kinase